MLQVNRLIVFLHARLRVGWC